MIPSDESLNPTRALSPSMGGADRVLPRLSWRGRFAYYGRWFCIAFALHLFLHGVLPENTYARAFEQSFAWVLILASRGSR